MQVYYSDHRLVVSPQRTSGLSRAGVAGGLPRPQCRIPSQRRARVAAGADVCLAFIRDNSPGHPHHTTRAPQASSCVAMTRSPHDDHLRRQRRPRQHRLGLRALPGQQRKITTTACRSTAAHPAPRNRLSTALSASTSPIPAPGSTPRRINAVQPSLRCRWRCGVQASGERGRAGDGPPGRCLRRAA
jgi:hypothetical protein